ncbi:hypothetical protein PG993_011131 [Apiospora rasikravindrae]|uniref:Uncharacterized protein n=1 Tax=Apiospora rasikravindrae TaxID=990691 RepID=A0ABR1SDB8_9PEZI
MPKTDSTNLSERDIKLIAAFMKHVKEKHKDATNTMDWTPYQKEFGFKGDRAAKDAFTFICLKLANIEKAMGSGPSCPGAPKKAGAGAPGPATIRANKRKRNMQAQEVVKKEASESDSFNDGGISDHESDDEDFDVETPPPTSMLASRKPSMASSTRFKSSPWHALEIPWPDSTGPGPSATLRLRPQFISWALDSSKKETERSPLKAAVVSSWSNEEEGRRSLHHFTS